MTGIKAVPSKTGRATTAINMRTTCGTQLASCLQQRAASKHCAGCVHVAKQAAAHQQEIGMAVLCVGGRTYGTLILREPVTIIIIFFVLTSFSLVLRSIPFLCLLLCFSYSCVGFDSRYTPFDPFFASLFFFFIYRVFPFLFCLP